MIRALQYVWSAPWGLVGLLVELLFRALGWVELREGREMVIKGPLAECLNDRGWLAITIVQQCLWFGPLMPIAYLVFLAIYGYRENPFEVDARKHAE